jgi:mxaC protein
MSFSQPWLLLLLLSLVLPLLVSMFDSKPVAWISLVPQATTSRWLSRIVRLIGIIAITSLVFGLAGAYQIEHDIERKGNGAHVVFVLDRSGSMNETFGGQVPNETTPAKSEVARDLLSQFVEQRSHDSFGVVGFSTQPFYMSPLTEYKSATQAAIESLSSLGLAFTNVHKGLVMGLDFFNQQKKTGSRVIVLVSDGAATLDHRSQKVLRQWFLRHQASLYWFFLRTENGMGIHSKPESASDDNPRVMPERYLDMFFKTLDVPYYSYEVDTAESLQSAINELDSLENDPLIYTETIPRKSYATVSYLVALVMTLLLIIVKTLEARIHD